MTTTTKGLMDEALLDKREGTIDNDNETTTWVEAGTFTLTMPSNTTSAALIRLATT